MRNKSIPILLYYIAAFFMLSLFVPVVSAVSPAGKWLIDENYKIQITSKWKDLTQENSFSQKKLVLSNSPKNCKIFIDTFKILGKWRNNGAGKFYLTLDKGDIEDMVNDYLQENYSSYIKDYDISVDVKKEKINAKTLPDGSLTGHGIIKTECTVSYKQGFITIEVGTVGFNGTLDFTGVRQ